MNQEVNVENVVVFFRCECSCGWKSRLSEDQGNVHRAYSAHVRGLSVLDLIDRHPSAAMISYLQASMFPKGALRSPGKGLRR